MTDADRAKFRETRGCGQQPMYGEHGVLHVLAMPWAISCNPCLDLLMEAARARGIRDAINECDDYLHMNGEPAVLELRTRLEALLKPSSPPATHGYGDPSDCNGKHDYQEMRDKDGAYNICKGCGNLEQHIKIMEGTPPAAEGARENDVYIGRIVYGGNLVSDPRPPCDCGANNIAEMQGTHTEKCASNNPPTVKRDVCPAGGGHHLTSYTDKETKETRIWCTKCRA